MIRSEAIAYTPRRQMFATLPSKRICQEGADKMYRTGLSTATSTVGAAILKASSDYCRSSLEQS
eukprot:scaffold128506_cov46-Prasinocladus_malaysianus.AAC.2